MADVELDRRFRKLDRAGPAEEAAMDSYAALVESKTSGIPWSELLANRVVIILGEAGSGKSFELQRQADVISKRGGIAFYVRLEHLVTGPLEHALPPQALSEYRRWRKSRDTEAVLFLDSVDEAKLRVPDDFAKSLLRFRTEVGLSLARSRVVISSRISEWKPRTDAAAVQDALTLPGSKRTPPGKPEVVVVQLEPLDRDRVRRFAEAQGVNDSQRFLVALDERRAWSFARRPLDVEGLISYWRAQGRLGSLSELIEHDLEVKLREREPRARQDPLTPQRARQGAEFLAASAILCRKLSFRIPEDGGVDDETSLDPTACLPLDWRPDMVRALLVRPLFDGESYGRIRFHHRQVLEYLASSWFKERMQQGCTTRYLRDVFFDNNPSPPVARPALVPVLAWLANGDTEWQLQVRQWIVRYAPWLHFAHGDPAQLPAPYKRQLLQAMVARFRDRKRVWLELDAEVLARLADEALAPDVQAIIDDRAVSEDLRADMLSFVRHGGIKGCIAAALRVMADDRETTMLRSYAAAVVRDIGSREDRQELLRIVVPIPTLESSLCACICEAVYPAAADAGGLAAILRKVEKVPKRAVDLPWTLKRHLTASVTPVSSALLLRELCELAREEPFVQKDKKTIPISARFGWVAEVTPTVLHALFSKHSLTAGEVAIAVDALWMLGDANRVHDHHYRDDIKGLAEASLPHGEVREQYLWRLVNAWRANNAGKEPTWILQVYGYYSVLRPDPADVAWLTASLDRLAEKDRRIATIFTLDLLSTVPIRQSLGPALAVFRIPELVMPVLWRSLRGARNHVLRLWYMRLSHTIASAHWWKMRWWAVRRFYFWLRYQWRLLIHIHELRSGKRQIWLARLAREAVFEGGQQRWTPASWEPLRKRRGALVAWAVKHGCMAAWRQFRPLLPHERPEPNSTDVRIVMGLAGLNSAFAEGRLRFDQMTDDDARLAVRYSVNELNGFAEWMVHLANARPDAVRTELSACIQGEWLFPAERERVHEVLADLVWRGEGLAPLVLLDLLRLVEAGDPPNISILEQALTVLITNGAPHAQLARLAAQRIGQYDESLPQHVLWLSVWLQTDAGPALDYLEVKLAAIADPKQLMIRLCSVLKGDRVNKSPLVARASYSDPVHMKRLVVLVYRHVTPREDIDRFNGEAYSPGMRDHAQDLRDSLLPRLAENDHPTSERALLDLAVHPEMQVRKEWVLHLMEARLVRLADARAWRPEDVRTFASEYETAPRTERELFEVACRRIFDLKDHLEIDDNSPRRDLRPEDPEADLRSWLARNLRERSRQRYTIPQEEEIVGGHPDLRFETPQTGPVSVEIKWAQRWTVPQLLAGLEDQLVGQYMRARNARFGIFIVGYIGPARRWQHGGRLIGFEELIAVLEDRGAHLLRTRADLYGLKVMSLDFRAPV